MVFCWLLLLHCVALHAYVNIGSYHHSAIADAGVGSLSEDSQRLLVLSMACFSREMYITYISISDGCRLNACS